MTDRFIPLVDLARQHHEVADAVAEGMARVVADTAFVLGPAVERFEASYAEYCGVAHCVGVGNGTDAVELALRGCGIGPGDEVIVPANTFIATAEAVLRTGAQVVLADCGEDYLLDPAAVADRLTSRTRAVVPVHLYGQMAPMKAVAGIVGENVVVVEDAAQSQGAVQDGRPSGSVGAAAATSFYPGKNLGAWGDAGAVTTDDDATATRLRKLRNHGGVARYEHTEIGVNSRMDGLQGVVLSAKLAHLDAWNAERRAAAARYDALLADAEDVVTPQVAAGNEHVWHLYVVRVPGRDGVAAALHAAGIGAGIHYPYALSQVPAFVGLGLGRHPVAERFSCEILSLPIFPGITAAEQERVVERLLAVVR